MVTLTLLPLHKWERGYHKDERGMHKHTETDTELPQQSFLHG